VLLEVLAEYGLTTDDPARGHRSLNAVDLMGLAHLPAPRLNNALKSLQERGFVTGTGGRLDDQRPADWCGSLTEEGHEEYKRWQQPVNQIPHGEQSSQSLLSGLRQAVRIDGEHKPGLPSNSPPRIIPAVAQPQAVIIANNIIGSAIQQGTHASSQSEQHTTNTRGKVTKNSETDHGLPATLKVRIGRVTEALALGVIASLIAALLWFLLQPLILR
jgi:hypothetical protein